MQTVSSPIRRERMCGGACSTINDVCILANAAEPMPPATSSRHARKNVGANGIAITHSRNNNDPPTISVRPLRRGPRPVSHSPPSSAPNASAPASMPVSVGDTMNTCRAIGATSA